MYQKLKFASVFVLLFFAETLFVSAQNAKGTEPKSVDFTSEWTKAEDLAKKGQPKAASDIIGQVYTKAREKALYPIMLKALFRQFELKAEFEENYQDNTIARLKREISVAKTPVRQILQSVLAQSYLDYYRSNRWQILQRSISGQPDYTRELKYWDAQMLIDQTVKNFLFSLQQPEELQKAQIADWKGIIHEQKEMRVYRPTLYDLLAHRAIDFYMSEEPDLTRPANFFRLNRPQYFDNAQNFASLKIYSTDSLSFKYQAIRIFQQLIRFHLNDAQPTALVDADLKRLSFIHSNSVLANKRDLYITALKTIIQKNPKDSSSADASYQLALQYKSKGEEYNRLLSEENRWDIKTAFEIAAKTVKMFPNTLAALDCRVLMEEIQYPSVNITMPSILSTNRSIPASLEFKNINKLCFKIIQLNYPAEIQHDRNETTEEMIKRYLTLKLIQSWTITLPDTGDYQNHVTNAKIPGLPRGYFALISCPDESFNFSKYPVSYAHFQVTDLTLIMKNTNPDRKGIVLHRESGEPKANVSIKTYLTDYNYTTRKYEKTAGPEYFTDKNGEFTMKAAKDNYNGNISFEISDVSGDKFYIENQYYYSYNPRIDSSHTTRTFFFTDRAIYRPGQTIYFKGIVLDQHLGNYTIVTNHKSKVSFFDVNGEKIAEQELTTNDFGSFNGSFVAPIGRLTGNMRIQSENGNVYFSVEEYKRPKFEVNFQAVAGSYKLGQEITVKGVAKAYSGAMIDGATVKYRITRNAYIPWVYHWFDYSRFSESVEIANGIATTNAKGEFSVTFVAESDETIDRKFNPTFAFAISADVTDQNGETRSANESVSVGYKSLQINTNIHEIAVTDIAKSLKLQITNLNGQPEASTGEMEIYRLQPIDRILRERIGNVPDLFIMNKQEFEIEFPNDEYGDETSQNKRNRLEKVWSSNFDFPRDSSLLLNNTSWKPGEYVLITKTKDKFGEEITDEVYFTAKNPQSSEMAVVQPSLFELSRPTAQPGENIKLKIGSSYDNIKALLEIEMKDQPMVRQWINFTNGIKTIDIPVTEACRGNFSIHVHFAKNNRFYSKDFNVVVPYKNRDLNVQFETFRDKLQPGEKEEWRIRIKDAKGLDANAEVLASLYDASLDVFRTHDWDFPVLNYFYNYNFWQKDHAYGTINTNTLFIKKGITGHLNLDYEKLNWVENSYYGGRFLGSRRAYKTDDLEEASIQTNFMADSSPAGGVKGETRATEKKGAFEADASKNNDQTLTKTDNKLQSAPTQIRKNFNETALFTPAVHTDENGILTLSFTLPDALTKWKLLGFAYTKDLNFSNFTKELVSQKNLMINSNLPRFLREGDTIEIAAKITNITQTDILSTAKLELFNGLNMQSINLFAAGEQTSKQISVKAGLSESVSWRLVIPAGYSAVTFRFSALSNTFTDAEETTLPVLSNRMLVTETMPLTIRGKGKRTFRFDKLADNKSNTLRNYAYTLEFSSNPAWYAVQALPYMLEYPYECSEQLFNRFYANTLASNVIENRPVIKAVFDKWKTETPEVFLSNLEKNQELKSVILEETPWLNEAKTEREQKQRIKLFFDFEKMRQENRTTLQKLTKQQLPNGGWPWFSGGTDDPYITQYIVSGIGHLVKLNALDIKKQYENRQILYKAVRYMDDRIHERYNYIRKYYPNKLNENYLGSPEIQYLYARSFFMNEVDVDKTNKAAFDFFKKQASQYGLQQGIYLQGMVALALHRLGDQKTALAIVKSLRDKALFSDEMGMYWRDLISGYYWYQRPIESQALMIELFDEVANDEVAVEDLKLWLLRQKQTTNWKTTKATSEAVYALLLRGENTLKTPGNIEIKVGNNTINTEEQTNAQAGTGYFTQTWKADEVKPELATVSLNRSEEGLSWGSLYWQYYEDLDKITPAQSPVTLTRKYYVERATPSGPVIFPIENGTLLEVGEKIIVMIELKSDRDMEYLHLKDLRASGFEPMNVLSGYRWKNGLYYYESTRDASSNFFISYMSKGAYVFEYTLRVAQKGKFSTGVTSIQCMYAPEFAAHSEGLRIEVSK